MTSAMTRTASQPALGVRNIPSDVTLRRLRTLERLYEQGYQNTVVDLTVRKLLERQVEEDKEQLGEFLAELARFETQFGMSSAEFYTRYQAGEMGDGADVFEWQILYQMADRLAIDIDLLNREVERD